MAYDVSSSRRASPGRTLVALVLGAAMMIYFGVVRLIANLSAASTREHCLINVAIFTGVLVILILVARVGRVKGSAPISSPRSGVAALYGLVLLIASMPSPSGESFVFPPSVQAPGDATAVITGLLLITLIPGALTKYRASRTSDRSPVAAMVSPSPNAIPPASPASSLSPANAVGTLGTVTFRLGLRGYDVRAVDEFLEKLTTELTPADTSASNGALRFSSSPLTPSDIRSTRFPVVLKGYRADEVDAFLDRVARELGG